MGKVSFKATMQIETSQYPAERAKAIVEAAMNTLAGLGFRIAMAEAGRIETFDFTYPDGRTIRYDIDRAWQIVAEKPKEHPVHYADFAGCFEMLERGRVNPEEGIEVNWQEIVQAPSRFDLTRPILVVPLDDEGSTPIDGWHRLGRAMLLGMSELPMVILTDEDVAAISQEIDPGSASAEEIFAARFASPAIRKSELK